MQSLVGWVLSIPFYSGLIFFFFLKFRVVSLLMEISPLCGSGLVSIQT